MPAQQSLISNMGLFWRSADVFWGRPGPDGEGRILGVPAKNRSAEPTDFREQEGIYVLYAEYRAVYIGQTTESQGLLKRLGQHRSDDLAERWDRFSFFGLKKVLGTNLLGQSTAMRHVKTEHLLNHIEGILIHAIEPPLNRQQGRFGEDIVRFLQVRDDTRLGLSQEAMVKELWRNAQGKKN
jgi:predicted GIY-YIG superfamily endonuclease